MWNGRFSCTRQTASAPQPQAPGATTLSCVGKNARTVALFLRLYGCPGFPHHKLLLLLPLPSSRISTCQAPTTSSWPCSRCPHWFLFSHHLSFHRLCVPHGPHPASLPFFLSSTLFRCRLLHLVIALSLQELMLPETSLLLTWKNKTKLTCGLGKVRNRLNYFKKPWDDR